MLVTDYDDTLTIEKEKNLKYIKKFMKNNILLIVIEKFYIFIK